MFENMQTNVKAIVNQHCILEGPSKCFCDVALILSAFRKNGSQ